MKNDDLSVKSGLKRNPILGIEHYLDARPLRPHKTVVNHKTIDGREVLVIKQGNNRIYLSGHMCRSVLPELADQWDIKTA